MELLDKFWLTRGDGTQPLADVPALLAAFTNPEASRQTDRVLAGARALQQATLADPDTHPALLATLNVVFDRPRLGGDQLPAFGLAEPFVLKRAAEYLDQTVTPLLQLLTGLQASQGIGSRRHPFQALVHDGTRRQEVRVALCTQGGLRERALFIEGRDALLLVVAKDLGHRPQLLRVEAADGRRGPLRLEDIEVLDAPGQHQAMERGFLSPLAFDDIGVSAERLPLKAGIALTFQRLRLALEPGYSLANDLPERQRLALALRGLALALAEGQRAAGQPSPAMSPQEAFTPRGVAMFTPGDIRSLPRGAEIQERLQALVEQSPHVGEALAVLHTALRAQPAETAHPWALGELVQDHLMCLASHYLSRHAAAAAAKVAATGHGRVRLATAGFGTFRATLLPGNQYSTWLGDRFGGLLLEGGRLALAVLFHAYGNVSLYVLRDWPEPRALEGELWRQLDYLSVGKQHLKPTGAAVVKLLSGCLRVDLMEGHRLELSLLRTARALRMLEELLAAPPAALQIEA